MPSGNGADAARVPAEPGRTPAWWSTRSFLVAALAAGVVTLALPVLPGSASASLLSNLLQLGAAATAALACFAAARRTLGKPHVGWSLLGIGATAWAVGQAVWTWSEGVLRAAPQVPSISDGGFLLFVPFTMVGLLAFATGGRNRLVTTALVLDGVLVTLGAFVLAWPLAFEELFLAQGDRLAAVLVVAYPLGDLALLGLAGGILMRDRRAWTSPMGLLYAGFACIAAADVARAFGFFGGAYVSGHAADAGWVAGFLAIGAAASSERRVLPAGVGLVTAGRAVPLLAVLVVFVAFIVDTAWQGGLGVGDWNDADPPLRIGMVLLILAALLRQFLFTQEFAGILRQREDAYGGLRRMERTIRVMSKCNQAVIRSVDEGRLAQRTCELLVNEGGYRRAWMARSEHDDGVGLQVFAHAGAELGLGKPGRPDDADPASLAIRDGLPQISRDLPSVPFPAPWQEEVLANGCSSRCALPLSLGDRRGVLVVCSAEPQAFAPDEVQLLQELVSEVAYGMATLRERQAREQAEAGRRRDAANYQSLVESASDGIFRTDFDGKVLFANQRGAQMLGFADAAALVAAGARMVQFYAEPAERAAFIARVAAGDSSPYEARMKRRDGTTFWAALRVSLRTGPEGRELVGTMEDITDHKQAEEDRQALARQKGEVKRLEELNCMRMDFLNAAAHDLKTPLTPLKLQMATLRMSGSFDARQRESLDLMDRNIGRFQVLIEDMLDVARLQAGRLKLRRSASDLAPLVREAVASFQESAKQARLEFTVEALPDVRIDADPMKSMQVLMNVVSNAIKYTPPGGTVRIGVDVHEREAVVHVRDSGVGLSPDQLARLFQPFVRLHEDRPEIAKGTGLGLYISKGIIEQHGGRVWAESPGPAKGSTFFVAWPLAGHGPPPAKPMAAA